MNVREMAHIIALAEEGSCTAAGRRMNISRQSIGKTVKKCESLLGRPLFVRTGGKAFPTPECIRLVADSRAVVESFNEFNATYDPADMIRGMPPTPSEPASAGTVAR